jgi:hypothetical protein
MFPTGIRLADKISMHAEMWLGCAFSLVAAVRGVQGRRLLREGYADVFRSQIRSYIKSRRRRKSQLHHDADLEELEEQRHLGPPGRGCTDKSIS